MGGLLSIRLKLKAESRKAHSGGDPCIDLHEHRRNSHCILQRLSVGIQPYATKYSQFYWWMT